MQISYDSFLLKLSSIKYNIFRRFNEQIRSAIQKIEKINTKKIKKTQMFGTKIPIF